jgi:type IV fimbrial biogenesis protein FimT
VLIMRRRLERGFNLLELMVVIGLIALILMTAVPSFQLYTQNAQTRTGAEALLAGLQVAKSEAIRRNVSVQMKILNGTTEWRVSLASDPDGTLQARTHEEGSANAIIEVIPGDADTVTFSGLGRITANADGTPPFTQITVDNDKIPVASDRRPLRIKIPTGGAFKLCDPAVAASDPRSCV